MLGVTTKGLVRGRKKGKAVVEHTVPFFPRAPPFGPPPLPMAFLRRLRRYTWIPHFGARREV